MRVRFWKLFTILIFALLFGVLASLLNGGGLDLGALWHSVLAAFEGGAGDLQNIVLFEIRLPRILLAVLVGASLAVSGAAFQGIFANALADPYILGASSGAALGAAFTMLFANAEGAPWFMTVASFAGAFIAVSLCFILARTAGNPPPASALLLSGTALGAFFSALLSMLLVVKDRGLYRVYYWLLGSMQGATWDAVLSVLPFMLAGICLIVLQAGKLDIMLQGDEAALSLGVNIQKTRVLTALGAALVAAAAVSSAGIIGFVGLIAPHSVRMLSGPSHKRLFPLSALLGALLLVLADLLSRSLIYPAEIPVGIVCSLMGCPFFLYLLAKNGRNMGKL